MFLSQSNQIPKLCFFVQGWVEKVERGSLLSSEVNLADLFHPNTFLNAIRQKTARLSKVSMDELRLVCSWIGKVGGAKYQVKVRYI